ncbi:hypothetical protein CVIRNUC_008923 [Coccomyxa viridis]|uniref:EF-hand domain-containing protein n=1 Tax=Coccomyxa viridis TaxID=1274662 RepID=A0AAV1IHN3_9CHLO|nr:hypothetical protein CVIRNUC_008923 [Coccomyxa viridis]
MAAANEDAMRTNKIDQIFAAFDCNHDGALSKRELAAFMAGVNPGVRLTPIQMREIVEQICYEYASFMGPAGLMFKGFKEMYDSGHGCPDTDYSNLGYDATPGTANLATATALAQVARAIDVWDPDGAARKKEEASAKDVVRMMAAGPAPDPDLNLETPMPKHTTAGAGLGAGSWVGSITKWAQSASRGASRESSPPQRTPAGEQAHPAEDKLAAEADCKLGAQARNMPASPSAWSIKAGSETAARPQELVAHYTAQRTRAVPEATPLPQPREDVGDSQDTAAKSIATAKRELASYKLASHATAQRAVLAARRALQELPDEATPGMSMEEVVEAVAAAKRALSSHPLPDPFQPSGAADLVAEARKHLGAIPTDYDDDGPVPPLQEALLAVTDAKLALEAYPMIDAPPSPGVEPDAAPQWSDKPSKGSAGAMHVHAYAPAVAHRLKSDGRAESASHSFMPEAPGNPAVTEGLHASSYIPESNPRAAARREPASEHGYLPNAEAAPEQSLRKKHASFSSQGSGEEPSQAKAAYTAPEPKQTGLRQSLSKLAHRFVPGAGLKAASPPKHDTSKHAYLPEADAVHEVLVSPADSRTHAEQTAEQASPELVPGSRVSQEDAAEEHAAAPGMWNYNAALGTSSGSESRTPHTTADASPAKEEEEGEDPGPAEEPEELMKWFGRDWTATASLRDTGRAHSTGDCFEDAQEELPEPEEEAAAAPSPRASPSKASSLARALSERLLVAGPALSCLTAPRAAAGGADEAEAVSTPYANSVVVNATPRAGDALSQQDALAQQLREAEEMLGLAADEADSLDKVLQAVQATVQVQGDAQWTARQLAALRRRAHGLPAEDAYAAHMATATLLASMGSHAEALLSFEAAIGRGEDNAKVFFRMGVTLFALQRFLDAEQAYFGAIKSVKPGVHNRLLPKIYVNLGITQEADGRLHAACDNYREAISINQGHYRAFKLLGSALYALGDLGAAEHALQQSLAINPNYSDASCDLGCVLCALKRPEEAKEAFFAAIESSPQHVEAHFNLGNYYRQTAKFEAAEFCYKAVVDVVPDHWRGLLNLAVAQVGLKRTSEAQKNLRRAFKASGYGGRVVAEMDKLRTMVRKTEDRQQLGELMALVTEKATVAVAVKPEKTESKKLFELPKRGLSGLLRRATPAEAEAVLRQTLDADLLKQLGPFAEVHPYRLEAQVTDAHMLMVSPKPDPGGAESSSQGHGQDRVMSPALAESLLRQLLPEVAPQRFQHLMRIIRNDFFMLLDSRAMCREVDIGLVLALLLGVANGDTFERIDAVHAVLAWRSRKGQVTEGAIALYIASLKAVFNVEHDVRIVRAAMQKQNDATPVSLQDFQKRVKQGYQAFELLRTVAEGR